jgi:molybdopterin-containing oxidoreductase family membrane subunit
MTAARSVHLRLAVRPREIPAWLGAEWRSMSRPLRAWLLALAGMCAIGGVAALIALPPGWEVLGTSPTVEWGLLISAYVFFAVTTSGLCLTSSLGTVFGVERFKPLERRHAILAILSLVTAFGVIAVDLHWPLRLLFGVVLSPAPSSPMWWMGVAYGAYLAVLVVEIWSMFTWRQRLHQAACTAAAVMAIIAPFTLGAVFGVVLPRPFWHGLLSPALMVSTALLSGTCLLALVFGAVGVLRLRDFRAARRRALRGVRAILTLAILLVGALVAARVLTGLGSDDVVLERTTQMVLSGPLAPEFWGGRVLLGIVVPLLLAWWPRGRLDRRMLLAGAACLLGVLLDRTMFVLAAQMTPASSGTGGVVSIPWAAYIPSPVEIGIVIGGIGFVALVYTLVERYVDLGESDMHSGLSLAPLRRLLARLTGPRPRPAEELSE